MCLHCKKLKMLILIIKANSVLFKLVAVNLKTEIL